MIAPALLALALASAAPVPRSSGAGAVVQAVRSALAVPGARAEVVEVEGTLPQGCALLRAELPRPLLASGRIAVRLAGDGARCETWAWVRVRVLGPVLVTARPLVDGDPLAGAVVVEERELTPGRTWVAEAPEGATAARDLPRGTALEEAAVRVGPRPGEAVTVRLRSGALFVEASGRAAPCGRGRACAVLPSGRRVEGAWHEGRIELESP